MQIDGATNVLKVIGSTAKTVTVYVKGTTGVNSAYQEVSLTIKSCASKVNVLTASSNINIASTKLDAGGTDVVDLSTLAVSTDQVLCPLSFPALADITPV